MTTIEFCEKSLPKKDGDASRCHEPSVYDLGICGNVRACLGSNPALWLFPCARPAGDGLNFMSDETRLTKDLESGKGIRRRTHQKTPRPLLLVERIPDAAAGLALTSPRPVATVIIIV